MNERREKILYVSEQTILAMLRWRQFEYIFLPVIRGVPEDVRIVGVHHDWRRHAFALVLAHESFEPVIDGQELRALNGPGETEVAIETARLVEVADPATVSVIGDLELATVKLDDVLAALDDHEVCVGVAEAVDRQMKQLAEPARPERKSWEFLGPPR